MARNTDYRQERDKFYIITNGKNTEKSYFELLKKKKSIYDVVVEFQNEDPIGLVAYAKKYLGTANAVWCVFDIDYTYEENRLIPALKDAFQNGINIAYSNKAFEVWLISHFEQCEKAMEIKDYPEKLEKLLAGCKYKKKYDKSDRDMLEKVFIPKYKDAVNNAKIVHQKRIKEHNNLLYGTNSEYPIWEWNSCTTVYKLVEALKLQEK